MTELTNLFERYSTDVIPRLNHFYSQLSCFLPVKPASYPNPDVLTLLKLRIITYRLNIFSFLLEKEALQNGVVLYAERSDRPQLGPLSVVYPDKAIERRIDAMTSSNEGNRRAVEEIAAAAKKDIEKNKAKEQDDDIFATFASVSVENKTLTMTTGDKTYQEDTENIMQVFDNKAIAEPDMR